MMEKLVLVYDVGDGYTWCSTEHLPVAYESAEALYVHLEEAIVKYMEGGDWVPPVGDLRMDFSFSVEKSLVNNLEQNGYKVFRSEHFYRAYTMPEILTLEDWFNEYMVNKNG
jgi:hypothetical protein